MPFIPKIFTEHIAIFALQNFFSFRIIEVFTLHILTQMKSYLFLINTQKLLSIYNGPKRVIQIKQKTKNPSTNIERIL